MASNMQTYRSLTIFYCPESTRKNKTSVGSTGTFVYWIGYSFGERRVGLVTCPICRLRGVARYSLPQQRIATEKQVIRGNDYQFTRLLAHGYWSKRRRIGP